MSVVSGVVLCTSCSDSDDLRARVQARLSDTNWGGRLKRVDDVAGGPKDPQMWIGIGGFNYLDEEEFATFVLALPWRDPGNVVLVIQPEDGATRVWRVGDGVDPRVQP